MKRMLLLVSLGLVGLVLGVGMLLPRKVSVQRTEVIRATPATVFAQVADLRRWPRWTPWQAEDPQLQLRYSQPSTGVGAWQRWRSDKAGNGQLTLTQVVPDSALHYTLQIDDWNPSQGMLRLTPQGQATHVLWQLELDMGNNPIGRWFALWMDDLVGADYDRGLAQLKRICERK